MKNAAERSPILNLHLDDLTSENPAMQRCLALAREAAKSDLPILLQGETGTGKTLLAQAIHNSSPRAEAEFLSFNASAMSDTLLESQLFGHEKGAFTGASTSRRGKFEMAHKGTLFFDEIADMSGVAQAKILRAVEYGEYERLGSEMMHYANVRIVSATNQNLRRRVRSGAFREDLYHRLNGLTLVIPALRDRPEDLPGLIAAELQACAEQAGKAITAIEPDAFTKLLTHSWPGNLRELHRVIQAVVLFTESEAINADDVILDEDELYEPSPSPLAPLGDPAPVDSPRPGAGYPPSSPEPPAPQPAATAHQAPLGDRSDLSLETATLKHVDYVYSLAGHNKRRTAMLLGISRSTLDRKLEAIEERRAE